MEVVQYPLCSAQLASTDLYYYLFTLLDMKQDSKMSVASQSLHFLRLNFKQNQFVRKANQSTLCARSTHLQPTFMARRSQGRIRRRPPLSNVAWGTHDCMCERLKFTNNFFVALITIRIEFLHCYLVPIISKRLRINCAL